jgi:hypothetical protein
MRCLVIDFVTAALGVAGKSEATNAF